ncbi:hypothetical protein [Bradyrhizobium japonicum]|uniref:hypothetical protein n=1 Tax=Bradyrhizobium japonicum TaxID=375 RepID=UPI001E49179C|nr:hypothetical protein [Bradyrhizobium japonicum]MCD9817973.1 hypothetical protein [Bradyrhizobium japonicum]MCD9890995.1 hypothetical protein [Bradyrhizobium japonicum]MEB2672184.1 hypothetical protein [Bradyrhizobium japonicum]WLB27590.1 hypothetical protein QIH85_38105 [Bradyrhizobium japonicum]WRI91458.1 hypothetical protein R3F75_11280 [Bradyrhizobium japonicum]
MTSTSKKNRRHHPIMLHRVRGGNAGEAARPCDEMANVEMGSFCRDIVAGVKGMPTGFRDKPLIGNEALIWHAHCTQSVRWQ